MSKGGAGKVYFVLYLAVILELLIIIVERDEAEEHLMAKQKESMKIVQSILSQLQTGTGVEGLATRPQDQIVLKDASWGSLPGMDLIKEDRRYQVDVGVTDVLNDIPKICKDDKLSAKDKESRLADFALASNVRELQYQIWQTDSKADTLPAFPKDNDIRDAIEKLGNGFAQVRIGEWVLKGFRMAKFNATATLAKPIPVDPEGAVNWFRTTIPVYDFEDPKGEYLKYAPKDDKAPNAQYKYDHNLTIDQGGGKNLRNLKVRAFMAGFNPAGGEGIYKLHFFSRTNKILGIRSETPTQSAEAPDDEKVNIGTVQLSVKDLRSVLRELERGDVDKRIEEQTKLLELGPTKGGITAKAYNEEVRRITDDLSLKTPEEASKMKLYGYIKMILRPNASMELEQNQASMGFSIRVVKPNIPKAEPSLADLVKSQRVISGVRRIVIPFTVNNWKVGSAFPAPKVTPADANAKVVTVRETPAGPGLVSIQYEVHVEGASASGSPKEYKINLTNPSLGWTSTLTDGSEPVSTVVVYPNGLSNKSAVETTLEKRVYIGRNVRLPIEPTSGGEIPANQFILSYALDGAEQKLAGSNPLQITTPCIGRGVKNITAQVKWLYKPLGTQYTEEVDIFTASTSNIQQGQPEVLLANTTDTWENKALKLTIGGIEVLPPKIDCGQSASDRDVKVDVKLDKPSLGKYSVMSTIEQSGAGQYKVVLQLKGARAKFPGEEVEVSISATVGSKTTVERKTVSIPEFK